MFPNPFSEEFVLNLANYEEIHVFDILGKRVSLICDKKLNSTTCQILAPAGIYILKTKSGNKIKSTLINKL